MTDPTGKLIQVANNICSSYKPGETFSTDKFDTVCQNIGLTSHMDLARRTWSWKEKVNEILMKRGLWLYSINPGYIKLADIPEHILRTTTFARLAGEIKKHADNASEQLKSFPLVDRDKERALSKIVWSMENLSKEVETKVLEIGELRTQGMGLLDEWIKGSLR